MGKFADDVQSMSDPFLEDQSLAESRIVSSLPGRLPQREKGELTKE
jgi:hypothetical protein